MPEHRRRTPFLEKKASTRGYRLDTSMKSVIEEQGGRKTSMQNRMRPMKRPQVGSLNKEKGFL